MIDLEKQAREGFRIEGNRLCDKYGTVVLDYDVSLREFGWGSPCSEYHFGNYNYSDYSIKKETQYNRWYLWKGSRQICELYHLGGANFKTIY